MFAGRRCGGSCWSGLIQQTTAPAPRAVPTSSRRRPAVSGESEFTAAGVRPECGSPPLASTRRDSQPPPATTAVCHNLFPCRREPRPDSRPLPCPPGSGRRQTRLARPAVSSRSYPIPLHDLCVRRRHCRAALARYFFPPVRPTIRPAPGGASRRQCDSGLPIFRNTPRGFCDH